MYNILHKIVIFIDQNIKKMDNNQLVDSILETVRTEIEQFVAQESDIQCPVEYETRLIEISRNLSRNLILGTQGKLPKSRNTKKKF